MNVRNKLSAGLTIAIIAWGAHFLWQRREELAPYLEIGVWHLAALAAAALVYIGAQGVLLKSVLLPQGIRLHSSEWFGCIVVTLMWNYVVPFAGIGYRAIYLKRVHGLEYQHFFASTSTIYVMEVLVFGLGGLLGIWAVFSMRGALAPELLLLFGGISAFALALLILSPKPPQLPGSFYAKLVMMLEAWYRAKRSSSHVFRCALWTVMILLSYCAMYLVAFDALNVPVAFTETFVVAALSDFSLFVRLTPAAIGPFEASVAYSARLYGMTIAQGLLAAGLIRAATIAVFLVFGPLFQYRLTARMTAVEAPRSPHD